MNDVEFRANIEYLGLNHQDIARLLEVNDRTVRRWDSGAAPVPAFVATWISAQNDQAHKAVAHATLHETPLPKTDEDMRANWGPWSNMPPRWGRHIVMRSQLAKS